MIELKVINEEFYNEYELPSRSTIGSAGFDIRTPYTLSLYPNARTKINLGFALNMNYKFYALLLPRSSVGKMGLMLANTTGLIDSDYQGEIIAEVWNSGLERIDLYRGNKFLQLVFLPMIPVSFDPVEKFSSTTHRGEGGFGSTNKL